METQALSLTCSDLSVQVLRDTDTRKDEGEGELSDYDVGLIPGTREGREEARRSCFKPQGGSLSKPWPTLGAPERGLPVRGIPGQSGSDGPFPPPHQGHWLGKAGAGGRGMASG